MIALILFLSTTVFVPIYIVLSIIPLLVIRERIIFKNNIFFTKKELLGFLIIGFSGFLITFLNIYYGAVVSNINDKGILGEFPYLLLIFIALLFSKLITQKDLRLIQFLIMFEIFVGVLEYIAGVPTFFKNPTGMMELSDTGILYQSRVFGFSSNSSNLAAKIIYLATISIMFVKANGKFLFWDKFVVFFILVGLFVTFNRTAIISILFSYFILFGFRFKNIILFVFPILIAIYLKWDSIVNQLTRGRGEVDLSGRDKIFDYFYNFWIENFFLGNYGTKLWWNSSGSIWHSHNSYLEFLASNGFLVSFFFIIGWMLIFGRKTIIVLPILIFSCFQYGFLWGFSFYDILIFSIIYIYIKKLKVIEERKYHEFA